MDAVTELKKKIGDLEKKISLRQIALQSGVNYITLRNIKFGKSTRVTDGVLQRLTQFHATFNPDAAVASAPKKRGRKPGSKNLPKVGAPKTGAKKPGRPPKAAPAPLPAFQPAMEMAKPVIDDAVVRAFQAQITAAEAKIAFLNKMCEDYLKGIGK